MGFTSDLPRVKREFPDVRRAVMYSQVRLQEASLDEIERDMKRIYDELSPCDIVISVTQATTCDKRVNELLQICKNLESRKG